MISRLWVYGRALGDALLPPSCTLCNAATEGSLLCAACTQDLPWNAPACPGCALPQRFNLRVAPTTAALLPPAAEAATDGETVAGERAFAQGVLCPACLKKPRGFDAAYAAFVLKPPVQQGIHALKYQAQFFQSALLAGNAATRLQAQRSDALPSLLIPVPLHWRRQWSRGYNQSLELARVLGKQLSIAVDASAAKRLRATKDQIGQSAAQRRNNLKGAFAVSPRVAGLHIALIDDVMTTGATLEELARACRTAGAARIEAWAIARQPLGFD